MGMNMIGKGCKAALAVIESAFADARVLALSGNTCTDKKSSATNWILGRGKSIVAEAILPEYLVRAVLKSDIDAMVALNVAKNLEGSALAGTIGGHNAHAANVVGAVFLATGQDAAQTGDSSMALTKMEVVAGAELEQLVAAGLCIAPPASATSDGRAPRALRASVTMPAIEVGTVGGGTQLKAQGASLRRVERDARWLRDPLRSRVCTLPPRSPFSPPCTPHPHRSRFPAIVAAQQPLASRCSALPARQKATSRPGTMRRSSRALSRPQFWRVSSA
jgi:hypothetical protein